MIRILYFAALRDALGREEEALGIPSGVTTLGELRGYLAARGGEWSALDAGKNIRVARNQSMAMETDAVQDGDEIAFFPPVTGG